jgi:hypothetical protein
MNELGGNTFVRFKRPGDSDRANVVNVINRVPVAGAWLARFYKVAKPGDGGLDDTLNLTERDQERARRSLAIRDLVREHLDGLGQYASGPELRADAAAAYREALVAGLVERNSTSLAEFRARYYANRALRRFGTAEARALQHLSADERKALGFAEEAPATALLRRRY